MRIPLSDRASYDVDGRTVLITGAGQGIGRALAEQLHGRGAELVLVDVNGQTLADVREALGTRVLTLVADVRDRDRMAKVVEEAVARFGKLDVVVANAGVTPPPATLRTIDLDAFDRVVAINQTGAVNTVRPALEQVIARRGHVVVVSSCAAFSPGMGGAAYMMSKAAAEQLGRALRLELAPHGATAGIAYFGVVDTELAHATLDDDALGHRVGQLLPWPLSSRITADAAARTIADGISRRAPSTMAPSVWKPYSLMRGLVNVAIDRRLVADKKVHALLLAIEQRTAGELDEDR